MNNDRAFFLELSGEEEENEYTSESEFSFAQNSHYKHCGKNSSGEDELDCSRLIPLRASTAPARPLTELEEFKRSSDFLLLENTVMLSGHLKQRQDNKYDLDSAEGQRACKRFLNQIERLCEVFKASTPSRSYRDQFSKAYKVLYKSGSLCYLTEILDSAQEGFPYLWVNGEKYVFSNEVLASGRQLFGAFCRIQQIIRSLYNRIMEDTQVAVCEITHELRISLEEFDKTWVAFE